MGQSDPAHGFGPHGSVNSARAEAPWLAWARTQPTCTSNLLGRGFSLLGPRAHGQARPQGPYAWAGPSCLDHGLGRAPARSIMGRTGSPLCSSMHQPRHGQGRAGHALARAFARACPFARPIVRTQAWTCSSMLARSHARTHARARSRPAPPRSLAWAGSSCPAPLLGHTHTGPARPWPAQHTCMGTALCSRARACAQTLVRTTQLTHTQPHAPNHT
jgi:hypothetical protein